MVVVLESFAPRPAGMPVSHALASADADSRLSSPLLNATAVTKTIWASGDCLRRFPLGKLNIAASPAGKALCVWP